MTLEAQREVPAIPPEHKPLIKPWQIVLGVALVLILVGLFIWFIIWLAQNEAAGNDIAAIRDIFIIALALESCVFGIILMILLVMVIRLINMLEFEVKPVLQKTNETVGMIRGTTVFVSQNVVKPVTTASSYVAGFRRGIKALFGDPKKNLVD